MLALYPATIYGLAALYIISINIHVTITKTVNTKHKYHKCIHQYKYDKKARTKHDNQKSASTVNANINTKAQSKKHKYYKCIHQYHRDIQKSTSTVSKCHKSTQSITHSLYDYTQTLTHSHL